MVCGTFWGQQPGFPAPKDVAQPGHLKISINEDASRGAPPLVCYEQFPGFKCRGQVASDLAWGRPHKPNLRSPSSKSWLWPTWVNMPTYSPAEIRSLCLLITLCLPGPTDSVPFTLWLVVPAQALPIGSPQWTSSRSDTPTQLPCGAG